MGKIILSLFCVFIFSQSFAQIKYSLFVEIKKGTVKGQVKIVSDRNQTLTLDTRNLDLEQKNNNFITINLKKGIPYTLRYSYVPPDDNIDFVNDRFIYLTGNWYPVPDKYVIYDFKALLPEGFEAVSEAEEVLKVKNSEGTLFRFYFPHPLDKIHLIASKDFVLKKDRYKNITIETFFFKHDADLAKTYIDAVKDYITEYEKLLTSYPYKRFAIVENIFQTGYSMPTFTLIGDRLIKYPFIIKQSLRHELLHQWFGNYVFIDYENGNWAEGLTTYLSDHYFYEKNGEGWKYRKNVLLKYKAFVNTENEYPVSSFRYKTDRVSEAIGYGKVMFIFHMLKNLSGEEKFYEGLKTLIKTYPFKEISWKEIQKTYEKITDKNLQWFFKQWVYSTYTPQIDAENLSLLIEDGKFRLSFDLNQKEKSLKIDVPVFIETVFGEEKYKVHLRGSRKKVSVFLDNEPLKIILDKNYDIFRKLEKEENVPLIADILGANEITVIVEQKQISKYEKLLNFFADKKINILSPEKVQHKDLKKALILLDKENPFINKYFAGTDFDREGVYIYSYENPFDYSKTVCLIHTYSKEEMDKNFYKVRHYGMYSFVHIYKNKTVQKGQLPSERGITLPVRDITKGIPVQKTVDIKQIIDNLNGKKIIYVGEQHTSYAHHIVQLNIIKGLYKKHKKLAVGMEMFQRKFQPVLDRYINGEISEKEFLKQTEYFKRWGFDYNLYKPILDFAKHNKIPVIALNIETEILKKVSKNGLESLTDEEKRKIPSQMDFSNTKYRNILRKIFDIHKTNKDFEHFFQSQILWDETMAETIDMFLRKNPEYIMVVVAGNGHLKYGFGIPDRCYRRNGFSYTIILNDEKLDKNIADYIMYPQEIKGKSALKLGVFIQETKEGLKVIDVTKNSIAEKAGIKKGDIIIGINSSKIKNLADLKLELFFLKKGDEIHIKIVREGKIRTLKTKI